MTEQSLAFTRGLPLPDRFTCGQPFAFSGLAGENLYGQDWCGVLTGEPGEIRFYGGVLLRFTESALTYDAVLPDLIAADGGRILVTFAQAQTIVGRSDTLPALCPEGEEYVPGSRTVCVGAYAYSLAARQESAGFIFALCRRADAQAAETAARTALTLDADACADQVLDWYQACPPCPKAHYENLWYKCLSVNRANVFSPQDGFTHAFTTPARLPHPDVCASDACYHALAAARCTPETAVDFVLAVLDGQREDGFIPRRMNARDRISNVVMPPMLCETVRHLFEITQDTALLEKTAEPLRRYVEWILLNHRSPNGLMTRGCSADAAETIEAVDYSVLTACELLSLHRIYLTLGDHNRALQMEGMHFDLAARINSRLWDENARCYYDRTVGGAYRRILTDASFLPLYAGICDPRQAHCLLGHLAPLLDLPFPIPSAAVEGVLLHQNYYVYVGLQRYGFGRQAALLRQKTLDRIAKAYRESGCVFGAYDPHGGDPTRSDTDCDRSASFIQLFLWG